MEEQKKRSIAKTLTWRITASLVTFVIVWIIAGDWKIGGTIAGIEIITKMFFYYFHERIWIKIKWGTKKEMAAVILVEGAFCCPVQLTNHSKTRGGIG